MYSVSCFPLHFTLYHGNLDYFSDNVHLNRITIAIFVSAKILSYVGLEVCIPRPARRSPITGSIPGTDILRCEY